MNFSDILIVNQVVLDKKQRDLSRKLKKTRIFLGIFAVISVYEMYALSTKIDKISTKKESEK